MYCKHESAASRQPLFSVDASSQQLHSTLLRITAACSDLQELRVASPCVMPPLEVCKVCSLAGGLPSLRLLHLQLNMTEVTFDAPLDGLCQLQDLRVDGEPLRMQRALALPPSLTRLHLGCFPYEFEEELPPQVRLPCMHSQLNNVNAPAVLTSKLSQDAARSACGKTTESVFCAAPPPRRSWPTCHNWHTCTSFIWNADQTISSP